MTVEISDEEYELFCNFNARQERELVQQSLASIKRLEDDIDYPIRKCIAALALLGHEPLFSCCGFDYAGQPYHKSHQYGQAYIKLKGTEHTLQNIRPGTFLSGWSVVGNGGEVHLNLLVFANPHWRNSTSIHFSEELAIGIHRLENYLLKYSEYMADRVTLRDTNEDYAKKISGWQYPPKLPWTIRKDRLKSY